MTLCEELYFEITLTGEKANLKKFVTFLKSGELDDFFEVTSEYIHYDDEFEAKLPNEETSIIFSNDDYGIEKILYKLGRGVGIRVCCAAVGHADKYDLFAFDGEDSEHKRRGEHYKQDNRAGRKYARDGERAIPTRLFARSSVSFVFQSFIMCACRFTVRIIARFSV